MAEAEVGDDVYGEDPTVNRLEERVARLAGMEAAVFACSGTQSNLLALLSHCQRGEEYIAGQEAHTYRYEGGGAAVLGGIQPQPLDFEADGTLDLNKVASAIKPDDSHYAITRLLCLENTNHGRALTLEYQEQARALADTHDLRLHLDGARAFNAAEAHGVPLSEVTRHYHSVSLCFSKGLGTPAGSLLCGGREFIHKARRWRKLVGGGLRQVGVLAAACEYALENNVERLHQDHALAARLAEGLQAIQDPNYVVESQVTNMVHLEFVDSNSARRWQAAMSTAGIITTGDRNMRLVLHKDISESAVALTLEVAEKLANTEDT